MLKDLCSVHVKRELYKTVFETSQQLQERILTLVAGQRQAIQDCLAVDTNLDGLEISCGAKSCQGEDGVV
ncbi:MAG: hypothetical protein GY696_08985 [Gammaproteobacteria bacterium]|nr:hypothetical protein [Gammaproteobacteria bacterium]